MSFKFKMQKVLDYRTQLEDEAKARYADAQARHQKSREHLNSIIAEIQAAEARGAELMQAAERWLQDQYIKGLRADRAAAALQERMLAQLVVESRANLTACAIDRKMLDKLKERQKKQFIRAEQKQELNFNDEISTIRHQAPAV